MTEHARVAIIGGGILGASLLYHLAKEGWTDCLLVEKAELTSGATWHAAGQCTYAVSGHGLMQLNWYGMELYRRIEAETGQSVSWHGCGSLRMAFTDGHMDYIRHTLDVIRGVGLPAEIIGPEEIRALHPLYDTRDIIAALHTPADGHVDPSGACQALATGARQMGQRILRRNRVIGLEQLAGGEWRLTTEQGDIVCEHVVNAAGYHARQVGAWTGLDLPIALFEHHYLVTDTVPELLSWDGEVPVVRDNYARGYTRQEQKSMLIGIYDTQAPHQSWPEETPWDSENELFEPNFDAIAPWLERAFERLPALADLGIKRVVNGAIPYTPDGAMLLGPAPGLRNHWLACGAMIGICWGPGAGRYLAQLMVHGAADISMRPYDPRRFGGYADRDFVVTRSSEEYSVRQEELPYPTLHRQAGRSRRKSALHDILAARRAIFEEVFGWERPAWYVPDGMPHAEILGFRRTARFDAVGAEARAVRERVGLADLSAFAKFDLTGRDVPAFLDRVSANRMPARDGRIVLTQFLNDEGRIEGEATIARLGPERFYLVTGAPSELRIRDWLLGLRRPGEEVGIENRSDELGILCLAGPRARDVLGRITDADLSNAAFPWMSAQEIAVAGRPMRALRVSYTGELAWELHAPMDSLGALFDALWRAGETHGIALFGSAALNALRMEKAYRGGHELAPDANLVEADMLRFAKLDKPEFLGRAATLRHRQAGPRTLLSCLEVETEDADCLGGEAVFSNGTLVGSVTSGGYGYAVGKSLALAYLQTAHAAAGTRLEISLFGERRPARVLDGGPYDPANARIRA
jgi:dimethylglycine dehydrogenase